MHNKTDEIIYVGKAIDLYNRVHQYFQAGYKRSPKIEKMVSHIAWFEYIICESEIEALVLECNLIKEHHPHYNTMLTDDKSYPYIKITVNEDFPRILFSHQMHRDHARYFGPYTNAGAVKDTIDLLKKTEITPSFMLLAAIAITSRSSVVVLSTRCFDAICLMLSIRSRTFAACSNSMSAASCFIFSSSSFTVCR